MAAQSLIERTVEIIVCLSDESAGMSVSNIAEALGMPLSAAHRLLTALARKGVVVQDEASKQYRLTLMLPALGMRYLSNLGFIEICRPTVDMLAQQTRELVRLAVVEGESLIWVAKAQGARSVLRVDPMAGRDAVPHVTAAGKAWLATLSERGSRCHRQRARIWQSRGIRAEPARQGGRADCRPRSLPQARICHDLRGSRVRRGGRSGRKNAAGYAASTTVGTSAWRTDGASSAQRFGTSRRLPWSQRPGNFR